MKKETKSILLRRIFGILFIFAAAAIQNTTELLPQINSARPFILIPAVISSAMFYSEIGGTALGIFGGAIWDVFSESNDGFMALFLGTVGFLCAFFIKHYMINKLRTCMVFSLIIGFIFSLIATLQTSYAFGFNDFNFIFTSVYLPSFIYTSAITPVLYFIAHLINKNKAAINYDI